MAVSVDDVIQRIEDSGILDDVELSAVRDDVPAAGGDSEKFVRVLVKNERLTAYQAQAIWKDKGQNFRSAITSLKLNSVAAAWVSC